MGLPDLEQLSKSFGLALALLIVACSGLVIALIAVYRENGSVHLRLETLLSERNKTLEMMFERALSDASQIRLRSS